MNALQAAGTLPWAESVCYMTEFQIPLAPLKVYEFNARLCIDPEFGERVRSGAIGLLRDLGLEGMDFSRLDINRPRLNPREMEALNSIALLVQKKGIMGNMALERTVAQDGYGMPAILAALIWVAVAVCVCLWVSIAGTSAAPCVSEDYPFYIRLPESGVIRI